MATVRYILKHKQKSFWTIAPDETVYQGIQLMAEHDVGALVVIENDKLVGIITERDFLKRVYAPEKSPYDLKIREVMTDENLVTISPEQTVDACMSLMTERQVRHIIVVEAEYPVGIVSIRDVVRQIVSEQEFMIMQLEDYIMACPPHLKPPQQMA